MKDTHPICHEADILLKNSSIWKHKKLIKEIEKQLQIIQTRFDALQEQSSATIYEQKEIIETQDHSLAVREETIGSLESRLEYLEKAHADLKLSHENITQRHLSQSEKFKLLSRSLSLEPAHNQNFEEFSRLITEDYMIFAEEEASLAGEAQAVLELHNILDALRLVVNFPNIAGKNILAIAGGFSSGKSAFINSFMKNTEVRLSTGINPVTVVPSYVACSDNLCIKIHAPNGGNAELDMEVYTRMSHEYVKGFGFDLRKILPFISVTAPLEQEFFQNICIVDTPGYNPGTENSILAKDKHSAAALVGQASAMIWMIGLDPAGTITQSDIDFISESKIHGDNLYIVLNKADVKAKDDIDDIMQRVAEDLDFYGIEYAGICAYSSLNREQDYGHTGKTLAEFFQTINQHTEIYKHFSRRIDSVFQQYYVALNADKVKLQERKNILREMQMFALEGGGTELYSRFQQRFQSIDLNPEINKLDELIAQARTIHDRLNECLRQIIANLGIHIVPEFITTATENASFPNSVQSGNANRDDIFHIENDTIEKSQSEKKVKKTKKN